MIRYLKLKYNVEYIVNITDIDDKIYQRALELKVDPNHLTTKYTTEFIECIKQLNIQDIKYKKASDHLSEIFNQIKILLDYCSLEWDKNCLNHNKSSKTAIQTVSISQARKPIYKSSVNSSELYSKYLDNYFKLLDN